MFRMRSRFVIWKRNAFNEECNNHSLQAGVGEHYGIYVFAREEEVIVFHFMSLSDFIETPVVHICLCRIRRNIKSKFLFFSRAGSLY